MPEAEAKTEITETKPVDTKDDAGATPDKPEVKADDGAVKAMKAEREARKAAEAELKAIKAEREAEKTKALEESGNYKAIADAHAAELAALKPKFAEYESTLPALKEKADRLDDLLRKQIDAQKASLQLSPAITKLLDRMSTTEQLEWLNENATEVAAKASAIPVPPATPGGSRTEITEEQRRKLSRPTFFQ